MNNNTLLTIAAIVMVVSVFSLGFTYYSVSSFKEGFLTGYVTQNGTIYINITSNAAINLTNSIINWSNGTLTPGATYAVLYTADGAVTNGTWQTQTNGFTIENIGTVNVSIKVLAGKTAATFIGGTSPLYQYNVTNVEAGSCLNSTGLTLTQLYNVNVTAPGTYVCDQLSFLDGSDSIKIDIKLGIPLDNTMTKDIISTDQIQITAVQSV
jgi:hypothetical protein